MSRDLVRTLKSVLLILGSAGTAMAQAQATWIAQTPANSPSARYYAAMAYDATRQQVVLFGGFDGLNLLSDTWVWDGISWTQKSPVHIPPGRSRAAMAYDAGHQQIVLFGGLALGFPETRLSDTWVWDGNDWTQKSPATNPSARSDVSMAYDAARGRAVLFGGGMRDVTGIFVTLSDTWLWDGGNWLQASPANIPPSRQGGAMAYDGAHNQVVLFGGSGNSMLSDTWVWDGTNWSAKTPVNSPSPRFTSLAYDSVSQRVFLFGGWPGNFYALSDTWAWNGTNWFQQSPTTSPSSRSSSALAYDAARQNVVLFGGVGPGFFQISPDTWLYHAGNLVEVTLSADSNQSSLGQPVSLTAAMRPSTATGIVTFYGGTTILGTAPVVAGSAVFTTVTLPAGSGLLRAYYSGDAADSGDISPPVPHTVTARRPTRL